ncbi:Glutamyl-tRNA reductase [Fusobacterium necrogenes]|uniref:Glutamyl-tRNA reductase n=1 Tax=Fusobacterium necrogenes TaxID=858 RepID=A0A377H054_9FUSO|nr:glutamyl-tRNA reductase [Fusobacterium necrogenes]STO32204.1 Glutamyl-tRNA reductase [Fusobacterium necrogenes]
MKIDEILVLGISHTELSTEEREKFIQQNPTNIIHKFFLEKKILGYINLSTCLRIEFYLQLADNFFIEELIQEFKINKGIFIKKGIDASEYLFKVSCGFFSIIKGEDQILAQIKKAYSSALEENRSSKILNTVFNKAIEIGKKFRTESKICHNALSLEAISLKFIKDSIGFLNNKKILILGVGDLAQAILYLLVKEKVKDISITNRTYHKALKIKNTFDVNVISFAEKLNIIPETDIIISVTSAPHLVLKTEDVARLLKPEKKYTFLDLAMPRDIEPSLGDLENVSLFNLDDIWRVYNKHLVTRDSLVKDYSFLVDRQLENLKKWFQYYKGRNI